MVSGHLETPNKESIHTMNKFKNLAIFTIATKRNLSQQHQNAGVKLGVKLSTFAAAGRKVSQVFPVTADKTVAQALDAAKAYAKAVTKEGNGLAGERIVSPYTWDLNDLTGEFSVSLFLDDKSKFTTVHPAWGKAKTWKLKSKDLLGMYQEAVDIVKTTSAKGDKWDYPASSHLIGWFTLQTNAGIVA